MTSNDSTESTGTGVFASFSDTGLDVNYIYRLEDNRDGTTNVYVRNLPTDSDHVTVTKGVCEVEKEIFN